MGLTVMHNLVALNMNNLLTKNNRQKMKKMQNVSSGMKINGAVDGASEYAISERMRANIHALEQNLSNVQNGQSFLKVAAGGIESIINELRSLKEKALNSANGTNTERDREALNAEFTQRLAEIDDTANTLTYNNKVLLDGTYKQPVLVSVAVDTSPTGGTTVISSGDFTITSDGVYELAAGYSGTITINAANVELKQATTAALDGVRIQDTYSGGTNLWLNNINIKNTNPSDYSLIAFSGTDNVLNLVGNNSVLGHTRMAAGINVGGGLTIKDGGAGDGVLTTGNDNSQGAAIGSDRGERSTADIQIDSGTINISGLVNRQAAIGSGIAASIGDITINGGTLNVAGSSGVFAGGAAIGSAGSEGSQPSASVGDITINGGTIKATSYYGAAIGSGTRGSAGDITINGGTVNASATSASAIGNGSSTIMVGGTTIPNTGNNYSWTGSSSGGSATGSTSAKLFPFNPMVIQSGLASGQSLNYFLNAMDSKALGLDGVKVTTSSDASSAIDSVDSALEYTLRESTRVGAYISRLDYTADNIVTMSENLTAAESVIRDADMAQTMVDYHVYNLLEQTSQTMLAQANQRNNSVLELLG